MAIPITSEMICFLTKLPSGALLLIATQPNAVRATGANSNTQSTSFSFLWLISIICNLLSNPALAISGACRALRIHRYEFWKNRPAQLFREISSLDDFDLRRGGLSAP